MVLDSGSTNSNFFIMIHDCPVCFKQWKDLGMSEYVLFLLRRNPQYVYIQDSKVLRHVCGNCDFL